MLIPIGTWQGRELWCQDDSGDTCYPGMVHKGFVKPIVPPYITFTAAASTWYLALVLGFGVQDLGCKDSVRVPQRFKMV